MSLALECDNQDRTNAVAQKPRGGYSAMQKSQAASHLNRSKDGGEPHCGVHIEEDCLQCDSQTSETVAAL